jgi:hypothetical protein
LMSMSFRDDVQIRANHMRNLGSFLPGRDESGSAERRLRATKQAGRIPG